MKGLIKWLAKVFNVNITKEVLVIDKVEIVKYVTSGVIDGDVFIKGDLTINGKLETTGGITIYKKN